MDKVVWQLKAPAEVLYYQNNHHNKMVGKSNYEAQKLKVKGYTEQLIENWGLRTRGEERVNLPRIH